MQFVRRMLWVPLFVVVFVSFLLDLESYLVCVVVVVDDAFDSSSFSSLLVSSWLVVVWSIEVVSSF